MIDQSSQFMAILTVVGEAKQANAAALGLPWTFSQMGVGDANGADPQPSRTQTKLINERRRAPLNQVKIDPKNTNVIIAEQVIPENVGGWWIREIGLYDADGDLVAVANCAPSFKPLLEQGTGKTQVVRINFIVTSAANVTLKIDPSVVLATRQYVDDRIIEVLPATRKAGTYRQVTINERGVVTSGTNPDTLAGNGIIDAYTKEQTDASFRLKANLASPALTGVPTAPTAALGNNTQQLANTAFVQAAIAALVSGAPGALDTLKELSDALGGDPNFATTIINALAGKAPKSTTLGGYGIQDVWTKTEQSARYVAMVGNPLQLKWSGSELMLRVDVTDIGSIWTSRTFDPSTKANKATTLDGYGITDTLTAVQINSAIQAAIAGLISGSPGALDTLKELADALGGDPNFANTIINALAKKADKSTTLSGYGIVAATQAEAEAITDNSKPMTALRVGQAIASNALPFMPVQQGGGIGQGSNKLFLGWDNSSRLKITVDGQDKGPIVLDSTLATETTVGVARVATFSEIDNFTQSMLLMTPKGVQYAMRGRPLGDECTYVGFVGGDTTKPYLRHVTSGVIGLAPLESPVLLGSPRAATQNVAAIDTTLATTAFVSAALDFRSLGRQQTWTDLTTSRALATVYTNTTSRPVCVCLIITDVAGAGSATITAQGVVVQSVSHGTNNFGDMSLTTIVPSGATYRADSSRPLSRWLELR